MNNVQLWIPPVAKSRRPTAISGSTRSAATSSATSRTTRICRITAGRCWWCGNVSSRPKNWNKRCYRSRSCSTRTSSPPCIPSGCATTCRTKSPCPSLPNRRWNTAPALPRSRGKVPFIFSSLHLSFFENASKFPKIARMLLFFLFAIFSLLFTNHCTIFAKIP